MEENIWNHHSAAIISLCSGASSEQLEELSEEIQDLITAESEEPETCHRCEGKGHVKSLRYDPRDMSPEDFDLEGDDRFFDRECPTCGGSGKARDPEQVSEMRHFYGPGWDD
jgi:DnaJ-class molecular chaperone